ncbi:hypothetical protein ACCS96_28330, partial [Rhizobium ruizarguesonis]
STIDDWATGAVSQNALAPNRRLCTLCAQNFTDISPNLPRPDAADEETIHAGTASGGDGSGALGQSRRSLTIEVGMYWVYCVLGQL